MKPRLIILSDLWGIQKSDWIYQYQNLLKESFEMIIYDSRSLGDVNTLISKEKEIHQQFINYGIETAVKKLVDTEKEPIHILAFSVGGTIAWKAGLKGLKIDSLYAISSTRLRYEEEKPKCKINLYFGGKDNSRPHTNWFRQLNIQEKIIDTKDHQLYTENHFINKMCREILQYASYDTYK